MPTLFFKVLSDKNKEQFVRDSYIELYSASDAPVEIDQVEFSEPVVEPATLVKQINTFDISYTLEVGYHRTEQYVTQEKYYDADLKKHLTRNVVKERTVTDWQPYRGDKSDVGSRCFDVLNDGDSIDIGDKDSEIASKYGNYEIDVETALNLVPTIDAEEKDSDLFYERDESIIRNDAMSSVNTGYFQYCVHSELPGDEQRNFHCDWKLKDAIAGVHLTERYKLGFDYEGHKCFIKQCACEKLPNIYCSYKYTDDVANKILTDKQNETENDPDFQRNSKIYKYLNIGGLGLIFLSIALSMANSTLGIIGIIIGIAALVVNNFTFGKLVKKQGDAIKQKYDHMLKEHKDEIRNKKIKALNERFAKMGMEPINKEELQRFFEDHKLTEHYHGA